MLSVECNGNKVQRRKASRGEVLPPIDNTHSGATSLFSVPDMSIGNKMRIEGDLRFHKLIRIDGYVKGRLIAPREACVIVGRTGTLIGNINGFAAALIEGKVQGHVSVDTLVLEKTAYVQGNITCKSAEIEEGSSIIGFLRMSANESDLKAAKKLGAGSTQKLRKKDESQSRLGSSSSGAGNNVTKKTTLIIVDPQRDFSEGAPCAVKDAAADADAIAEMIMLHMDEIEQIIITLDTHNMSHIAQSRFWKGPEGDNDNPPPNTVITTQDVLTGRWIPQDTSTREACAAHVEQLERFGKYKLRIQPDHCLIGSTGHAVVAPVDDALRKWAGRRMRTVTYVKKGMSRLVDTQSAFAAYTDDGLHPESSTSMNRELIQFIAASDKVLLCGFTQSRSFNFTVRDFLEVMHKSGLDRSRISIIKGGPPLETRSVPVSSLRDKIAQECIDDDDDVVAASKFWSFVQNSSGVSVRPYSDAFIE